MKKKRAARREKYPYLFGCYSGEKFERELPGKFLDARVVIRHYKGAMLLSVLPARPKKGERHTCTCPSIQFPAAWLRGDDLDAPRRAFGSTWARAHGCGVAATGLIAMLRESKRVWLKAYKKAAREVARRDAVEKKIRRPRR